MNGGIPTVSNVLSSAQKNDENTPGEGVNALEKMGQSDKPEESKVAVGCRGNQLSTFIVGINVTRMLKDDVTRRGLRHLRSLQRAQ